MLMMPGESEGFSVCSAPAPEASRRESKALDVVTNFRLQGLLQAHAGPPVDASPTSIRHLEDALPASPTMTTLTESDLDELDLGPALLEQPEFKELSSSTAELQEKVKQLEQRAFASEQERQRLLVGVWRGVTGNTTTDSDEDVIDEVWRLARERDIDEDDSHFPQEGAKKDIARFLVGLMPTLPPRAVRLAGIGSFVGAELGLDLTRPCSPMFDDKGTPSMCQRARFA